MGYSRMRVGPVLAITGLPVFVVMHSRMRDSCSAQTWLRSDDDDNIHPADDDIVSLLQKLKEPLRMFPRGHDTAHTKETIQRLIQSNISDLVQDDQMASLANVEQPIHVSGQSSVVALNLTPPLLLQKSEEKDAVGIACDTSAQDAQVHGQSGHLIAYGMVIVACFIVAFLCVHRRASRSTPAASSLLKGTESQAGSRQALITTSTNSITKVRSPRSPGPAYVSQFPGSSTLPPPNGVAPPPIHMSETTFEVPLADFLELAYLSTGYFNVVDSQQTVFHAEVRVTPSGRILEVSQVYAPGNSHVLVSVGEPVAAVPLRPAQMHGLPADVLEVRTRHGMHSTIESYGRGGYQIMQDGRKAFIIDGSPVELEINVTSASSGRPVARMQQTGANQALATLKLSIVPGVVGADPLPILATLLAVVVLRAWPVRVEDAPQAASRGESAASMVATQSLPPLQQRSASSLLGLNAR